MNPDTQGMTEKCAVHLYSKDRDLLRDIVNTGVKFHVP
jgi:hypothetical protein